MNNKKTICLNIKELNNDSLFNSFIFNKQYALNCQYYDDNMITNTTIIINKKQAIGT